ncbi:MAG: hypothetical protein K0S23_1222 [Fluviicola sp.]|jgi:hypothetical protein|uniref:hypothetical protein n=1 Tax=Fluviicola sp. TaxID=1917219 RepID=UPI00262E86DA|nr:hypothetical protein [Fluviicola sp.]MDF3026915.1 hypothetical protein [Fluviicola sp.]
MNRYLDIEDRNEDYNFIQKETFRAEKGIRAIGIMYHDHSNDRKSYDNVFRLKDNIEYRLMAATHQYLVFLRELALSERTLHERYMENPNSLYEVVPGRNPYLIKVETELSSIFDSIVFHLSSVFDYLSHSVCYMYFTNKEKTVYWTKLAKTVRGEFKDKFDFSLALDEMDRRFVGRLYDYRSRLLHNTRDKHRFDVYVQNNDSSVRLKIASSDSVMKHFTLAKENIVEGQEITLTYLASWLLRRTFIEIEHLLDAIKIDIQKNSHFQKNVREPKPQFGDSLFTIAIAEPGTPFLRPVSDGIWEDYKSE